MTRYKVLKFDDFSDGEGCPSLEDTEKKFKSSSELCIKKGETKLGQKIKSDSLFASAANWLHYDCAFSYREKVYFVAYIGSVESIFYFDVGDGSVTKVYDIPSASCTFYAFIKFRDLVILNYYDSSYANLFCKYSTNGLTMTTWADTNLSSFGSNLYIADYVIVHDRLYILCSDSKIYYTDDGITFVLFVTLDSVYKYDGMEHSNGYLYVLNATSESVSGLLRISLGGEIQDEIIPLRTFYLSSFANFAGGLYFLVVDRFLYKLNSSGPVLVFEFENTVRMTASRESFDLLFFTDRVTDEVIVMDLDEKFSRPFKTMGKPMSIHTEDNFGYTLYSILQRDGSEVKIGIYENDEYISTGNMETRVDSLNESLGVAKQLILIHDPLPANASIEVFYKIDGASAWGSAVITSDTLNSVRKVYDIPKGSEFSKIQAKIEYKTSDNLETPKNAKLYLLYSPIGLSNSN